MKCNTKDRFSVFPENSCLRADYATFEGSSPEVFFFAGKLGRLPHPRWYAGLPALRHSRDVQVPILAWELHVNSFFLHLTHVHLLTCSRESPPNFEMLVLGCIDDDFRKR